jgi:hypothetical protein
MLTNPTTAPDATRLISRLRDTADAYSATGEAIPDRTIRILCDGLASVHRLFATELSALLRDPAPVDELFATTAADANPLYVLLDRSCQLEDQFRQTLRAELPNDVDLFIYRLYAKVRRSRERLLSVLMVKPHLTGRTPLRDLPMSRCA